MSYLIIILINILIISILNERCECQRGGRRGNREPCTEGDDNCVRGRTKGRSDFFAVDTLTEDISFTTQQTVLNLAREKWNLINNGFYYFQFQKSCFCSICNIQSMDVYVENNLIFDVKFAEGNGYGLQYFCENDDNQFTNSLQESSLTINDIFDKIQTAIINRENIGVIYHDSIGIPLSISINPTTDTVDDEIFISINCFQFDTTKTPSPVAVDFTPLPTQRSRGRFGRFRGANTIIQENQQLVREKYNTDDLYSCHNIGTPSCPIGYFYCYRFSDGCNTCTCNEVGDTVGCTKRLCQPAALEPIRCVDCESNTEWAECGGDPNCIPNCEHRDNFCGIPGGINFECDQPRCECPTSIPRWNGYECLSVEECELDVLSDDIELNTKNWCPTHCSEYNDGCLSCSCDENRKPSICQADNDENEFCTPFSFENRKCLQCQDDETMEFTLCGIRDRTCNDTKTFIDEEQCIEKCQCKPDTPIYDPINKKCIPIHECDNIDTDTDSSSDDDDDDDVIIVESNCIEHCPVYYNGCNACQCPNYPLGPEFCSNIRCSIDTAGTPTCIRCEVETMEYTTTGKCDRTCDDIEPDCLFNDGINIEKCQCPLDLPIYDAINQRCITAEQCDTTTLAPVRGEVRRNRDDDDSVESGGASNSNRNNDNSNDDSNNNDRNNDNDSNDSGNNNDDSVDGVYQNFGQKSESGYKQLELNGDEDVDNDNYKKYQLYIIYGVIGIICAIAAVVLVCWPYFIVKYHSYKTRNISDKIGTFDDDEPNSSNTEVDYNDDDNINPIITA